MNRLGMQPEKLGRYEIGEELGRGAMGRVFLAHDPEIDRKVAIKVIQFFAALPEQERDESRQRFLREARSAGRLLHPGIVTLFDVGEADGALYLAMEYVEGTTVDHYCKAGSLLPVPEVVQMVSDAAEALAYAHEAGIVHRDIKPANLMRAADSSVKVMDFGLAKASEAQLTQDGALLGTPSYMSPEQIRGEQLDGRSDLFSLGVVLYELLTGERPFPGDSVSSIIYRIVNEEPQDPAVFRDRVPDHLAGFLVKALAKDPDERFADGTRFAAELRRAAAGLDAGATIEPAPVAQERRAGTVVDEEAAPTERSRPPRTSVLPWVIGIVIVVAGLAGAGYYFREELGLFPEGPAPVTWLETRVRAEPAEAVLELDGVPLDPQDGGLVRFRLDAPPVTVTATHACRRAEREILPSDAGGEVVVVLDPVRLAWRMDPDVEGCTVRLNGEKLGNSPVDLDLDLCLDNTLRVEADGFHPAEVQIPSGATPLEARRLLGTLLLSEIPKGTLVIPETRTRVVFRIDGRRLESGAEEVALPEGRHTLRATNDTYWIDVQVPVEVQGGQTVSPQLPLPALTTLVVQAFPANCKVFLRRPGGKWKYVDDTPVSRRIAVGRYEVRVQLNPTGETREQTVDLVPGENPPIRVAFGRNS
jgi:serine/threonine-protein kinase